MMQIFEFDSESLIYEDPSSVQLGKCDEELRDGVGRFLISGCVRQLHALQCRRVGAASVAPLPNEASR